MGASIHCYAQSPDYIFRHITVNEGLIDNKVTAICQDGEGFMWIGTQSGLQRYDGTRFKNYLANIRDTAALQSDWISSIFEDSKKRLWIGTDHGAPYIFNRHTGKFYNYNLHAASANKINGIWHFTEDKLGNVWIAGHDGYYRLNEQSNQFEKFNNQMGIDKNLKTGCLTIDGDNNLWMATTGGVKFYNQQQKKLYGKEYNPMHNPLFDIKEGVANILTSGNYLWVSTGFNRNVYRYSFVTQQIKLFTFAKLPPKKISPEVQNEMVSQVYVLKDRRIIVPIPLRGLAVYYPAADSFRIVNADNTKSYAYHVNENIANDVCLIQDKSDNILIGNEAGISIFNLDKQLFFTYGQDAVEGKYFPKAPVSDFLQQKNGDIFISYYYVDGGIVKTDSTFNFKKHYLFNENGNKISMGNQVWNLFKDDKGIIWGPNQRNSILKFNPLTEQLNEAKDSLLSGPILSIKQDTPDEIWLAHWKKGLVKLAVASREKNFYTQFLFSDSNTRKMVQSILLDNDKIWVGTLQSGLQVFDKIKEKFTEAFVADEKNNTAISSNSVTDIIRYNRDTLILGTEMGVNIFDIKRKIFKTITVREGLPNNLVLSLMTDANLNLWVACAAGGLCKINMRNFSVTSYGIYDGVIDNIFTSKFYLLQNNKALIGTSKSFIAFNPSDFKDLPKPTDVFVTDFTVFGKEMMVDSLISGKQPVKLSYRENSLRIEFASLQFWDPGSIKYYYKLDGADKDWILADKDHAAVYSQLKDGGYTFNVKCANRDGVFCESITQLKIIIQPPFWKTWWFTGLVFLCVFLLLYSLYKWRIRNIKAIEAEKIKLQQTQIEMYSMNEQLSKAKLDALRSQMNPHFIFNSLNAIQECILTNKVDAAYEYLSKFSKLQRMVLNNSEKELIPLSKEIEMLQLYLSLESLRFNKSFTYRIDTKNITEADEIMIPSLVTQPFVENAIWHGLRNKAGDKTLEIVYEEKEGKVFITIDDNGIGREEAATIKEQKLGSGQYASKGTMLLQQRLHVLSQQFKAEVEFETIDKKDEQENAGGTKVVISFPSNLEALS